jgi:hypothetical protein
MIIATAIKTKDGQVLTLPRPARHHDIIRYARDNQIDLFESIQGFIADHNHFVDRYTAYIIAAIANQVYVDADTPLSGRMLFSEDLW